MCIDAVFDQFRYSLEGTLLRKRDYRNGIPVISDAQFSTLFLRHWFYNKNIDPLGMLIKLR
jgi:hypothetical protein